MKIVIATPLYPPDTAPSAAYVKEVARRLSPRNSVTVVAYGRYPEQVAGVRVRAVSKRYPLPVRLFLFTVSLFWYAARADVIYAHNGASAEVPAILVSRLIRTRLVFGISDQAAHEWARSVPLRRRIEEHAASRAAEVITSFPPARPEILPFSAYPASEMESYERAWEAHLAKLSRAFDHGA